MGYLKIPNLYKEQNVLLFKRVYSLEKIHGCLHADSEISITNGLKKAIKDIKIGDEVISYNIKGETFITAKVDAVIIKPIAKNLDWYSLEFDNGKTIVCTEDHPILTENGWIQAKDLSREDRIIHFF